MEDEATVMSLMMINYDVDHLLVSLFWDKSWKEKLEESKKKASPLLEKVNKLYG